MFASELDGTGTYARTFLIKNKQHKTIYITDIPLSRLLNQTCILK